MTRNNRTNETTETRETNRPALIAWHVAERGKKTYWTRIGAAWDHEDAKGLTLQLDLVPANGGRVVLREPGQPDEAGDDEEGR